MPDFPAMIKRAKEQLQRATDDLKLWESYDAVEVADAAGKTINLRSQMVAHAKASMLKFREAVAFLTISSA
jgi:hypothetical protein